MKYIAQIARVFRLTYCLIVFYMMKLSSLCISRLSAENRSVKRNKSCVILKLANISVRHGYQCIRILLAYPDTYTYP